MPESDRLSSPLTVATPTPAARERAVELLTRNYAADQLTEAELQARLDRVYQAGTLAELQALIADLPAEVESAAPEQRILATFSGQEQRLTGPLPRYLELRARFGYVELDLTHTTPQPGTTDIDVHSFAGYVEIRLPPGVRVESTGRALLGYFALKGGSEGAGTAGEPLIRIRGRAVLGYAECYRSTGKPGLPGSGPGQLESGVWG